MKKFIICLFFAITAVASTCQESLHAQNSRQNDWTPWKTSIVAPSQVAPPQVAPALPSHAAAPSPLVTVEETGATAPTVVPVPKIAPLDTTDATAEIANIILSGNEFVQNHRWAEARVHFEKAARRYPENAELRALFLLARAHLDVQNRYADPSFQSLIENMSLEQCLALHDEIFNNIQKYHVDTPHWKLLLEAGLDSLNVAASEPSFLERYNISAASATNLHQYLVLLKKESEHWTINSFPEMRRYVLGVSDSISKGISISPVPVILELVCGMTNSLDSYSTFLTRNQIGDVYSMIDGHFVGLGLELKSDDYSLVIVRVIPNSPAALVGLGAGERIVAIDNTPTCAPHTFDQAANLLQGPEGSSVRLTVVSTKNEKREETVVRRQVEVPSVENVRILNQDSDLERVGYLRISCFQKTTVAELVSAMRYLDSQGMKLLMIDLRQNPGGLLQEAIEATNLFVDKGTIVKTRGREQERPYYATPDGTWKVPLIVLIDGNSASASEIFAGGIRENNRGRIVGTRSYGKGTVQAIIQLSGGSRGTQPVAGLRLTTEKFYSPLGRAYSGAGVEPDVLVLNSEGEQTTRNPFQNVSQTKENVAYAVADASTPVNTPMGNTSAAESTPFQTTGMQSAAPTDSCLDRAFEEAQRILMGNRTVSTPL